MSKWKELKIDKLPEDILTGDYEFQYSVDRETWSMSNHAKRYIILQELSQCIPNQETETFYRYRKPEPLPPTHEEIMTKWWKHDNNVWFKVIQYDSADSTYNDGDEEDNWHGFKWFTGRESADIPPEGA